MSMLEQTARLKHGNLINHKLTFTVLVSFVVILSGCNSAVSGKLQTAETTPTTPTIASSSGNFCSPARAQKIKTLTASGVSKYTAYISVGSSQVAAQ